MIHRLPVPSSKTVRVAWYVAGLLAVLVLAWAVWAVFQLSTDYRALDNRVDDRDETIDTVVAATEELDRALDKANRRLEKNDLVPVTEPDPVDPDIIAGATGATGATGAAGADGVDGKDGADGPRGLRGFDGLPGDSIIGPEGPRGPAGADGIDGKDGADGIDGKDGVNGADSTVPGPAGADGADGADGKDGANGTDAVPFTFLFTIPADETLPDTSPAQTYRCVIPTPGGPFTCEVVAA